MVQFRSNENPMFRSKFSEDIFKQKYSHHNCETWDALASVLVDDVCQTYMTKDEKDLKVAMGNYEDVATQIAGKEQQLNFSNKVDRKGDLTDPNAEAQTTIMDPITIAQQAQASQSDSLGGEADTVPIIGAEDESNFYILQTREKLGIYV